MIVRRAQLFDVIRIGKRLHTVVRIENPGGPKLESLDRALARSLLVAGDDGGPYRLVDALIDAGWQPPAEEPEPGRFRVRVYRGAFGSWWAEVWRPRQPDDPPPPPKPVCRPPLGPNWVRVSRTNRLTRRGAHKATRKLLARARAGDPHDLREEVWTAP